MGKLSSLILFGFARGRWILLCWIAVDLVRLSVSLGFRHGEGGC